MVSDRAILSKNLADKQERYFVLKETSCQVSERLGKKKKIYLVLILRGRIAAPQRYTVEKSFCCYSCMNVEHV